MSWTLKNLDSTSVRVTRNNLEAVTDAVTIPRPGWTLSNKRLQMNYQLDDITGYSIAMATIELIKQKIAIKTKWLEEKENSRTDPLTELANLRGFNERLEQEGIRARRHDYSLTVLIMDIDGFKRFNDTLGHPFGDTVLKEVASIMRRCFRSTDVLAHLHGDEFAVILPETGRVDAADLISRFFSLIEQTDLAEVLLNHHLTLSVSVGVSSYSVGMTFEAVKEKADRSMYSAKRAGKGSTCSA